MLKVTLHQRWATPDAHAAAHAEPGTAGLPDSSWAQNPAIAACTPLSVPGKLEALCPGAAAALQGPAAPGAAAAARAEPGAAGRRYGCAPGEGGLPAAAAGEATRRAAAARLEHEAEPRACLPAVPAQPARAWPKHLHAQVCPVLTWALPGGSQRQPFQGFTLRSA